MTEFLRDLLIEYTHWFHDSRYNMDVPRPSWVADTAVTAFLAGHRIEIKEN
jgi:hypothetical protein